jgi:dihydrofolate reductase
MEGGTTFHFVTEGIEAALERAVAAAGGTDVRLGGGTATIRESLQAGLLDELHLAVAPVLLGRGENLFAGLDLVRLGLEVGEHLHGEKATHVVLTRRGGPRSSCESGAQLEEPAATTVSPPPSSTVVT